MNNEKHLSNQITEGAIWKQLLLFFFPILLGTFFQQLYNTIDMIIVGRFVGKEALASVGGSAGMIVNLIVGFFTGLSSGAGVIISQHYGAENKKGVTNAIHTSYAFSIVGSVIFMILGILASPGMLRLMNTAPELIADSTTYLYIYFAGIIFVFIFNIGSAIMRAMGDSKRPLYYLIICSFINIILDLVMVVFLHLGVPGVALATVMAQAVSAILVTVKLMDAKSLYPLKLREIRFYPYILKSQLKLGIPGGVQSVMYSLSNVIIQAAINVYGTNTIAAWATASKIDAVFWMVNGAYGAAITTFVGQNYGAGRMDRLYRGTGICLAMYQVSAIVLSTMLFTLRTPLFKIFTSDLEVIQIGGEIMAFLVPFYIIFSFIEVLSSSLRGTSDVLIPMLMTMFGVCLLRVVWIFFAVPLRPSLQMILTNYPVTWIITSVMFVLYFFYRKRHMPQANI